MEKKQIGVLAVQGAFAEHIAMVRRLGAEAFEIRQLPDLERPMDGLILPGGESTAMRKLLDELGLYEPLRAKIAAGLPVYPAAEIPMQSEGCHLGMFGKSVRLRCKRHDMCGRECGTWAQSWR